LGNNSDLTNAGLLNLQISNADARISSTATGAGTFLPMTFRTFGSEKLRIAADATGTYTFGGTAPRITGDFSNATVANRVMFQTSTANGATTVFAIPNGTSTTAGFFANNNSSDPANGSEGAIQVSNTEVRVASSKRGTGADLPLTFYTGGSERMRIATDGQRSTNVVSTVGSSYSALYPAYDCRAWVNFNGTGTVAIRASGNVSSITDNGTGIYAVNFASSMPDADYSAVASSSLDQEIRVDNYSTGAVRVVTDTAVTDAATVSVAIFR